MYSCNQVVHNLDTGKPVRVGDIEDGSQFAYSNIPPRTTHYIEPNPKFKVTPTVPTFAGGLPQQITINGHEYRYSDYYREQRYSIALPTSVEEAERLLAIGRIVPAPFIKE